MTESSQNFSIPIPHLRSGQSVLYAAATAVFTDEQKRTLLPIAVDRNSADQAWASKAAAKATLKEALDELETRIGGKPSRFVAVQPFYDLKPATKVTLDSLSTFFFKALEAGNAAKVAYDLIAIKFLRYVPDATKLFTENEGKIIR